MFVTEIGFNTMLSVGRIRELGGWCIPERRRERMDLGGENAFLERRITCITEKHSTANKQSR
jgi:hypothetical protein